LSGFFNGKNLLGWDVGPALFSKVTLFSQSEVLCSVGLKYMDAAAGRAQVLRVTTKKKTMSSTFFRKKCTLAASAAPPSVKNWGAAEV